MPPIPFKFGQPIDGSEATPSAPPQQTTNDAPVSAPPTSKGVLNFGGSISEGFVKALPKFDVEASVDKWTKEYPNVPKSLVMGMMKQESGGQQTRKDGSIVTSSAGALGRMQLMPSTARMMGVNPHDEDDNIKGGVKLMSTLIDKYNGDYALALAAYNAGEGNVAKAGNKIPNIAETKAYVPAVLSHTEAYQQQAKVAAPSIFGQPIAGSTSPATSTVQEGPVEIPKVPSTIGTIADELKTVSRFALPMAAPFIDAYNLISKGPKEGIKATAKEVGNAAQYPLLANLPTKAATAVVDTIPDTGLPTVERGLGQLKGGVAAADQMATPLNAGLMAGGKLLGAAMLPLMGYEAIKNFDKLTESVKGADGKAGIPINSRAFGEKEMGVEVPAVMGILASLGFIPNVRNAAKQIRTKADVARMNETLDAARNSGGNPLAKDLAAQKRMDAEVKLAQFNPSDYVRPEIRTRLATNESLAGLDRARLSPKEQAITMLFGATDNIASPARFYTQSLGRAGSEMIYRLGTGAQVESKLKNDMIPLQDALHKAYDKLTPAQQSETITTVQQAIAEKDPVRRGALLDQPHVQQAYKATVDVMSAMGDKRVLFGKPVLGEKGEYFPQLDREGSKFERTLSSMPDQLQRWMGINPTSKSDLRRTGGVEVRSIENLADFVDSYVASQIRSLSYTPVLDYVSAKGRETGRSFMKELDPFKMRTPEGRAAFDRLGGLIQKVVGGERYTPQEKFALEQMDKGYKRNLLWSFTQLLQNPSQKWFERMRISRSGASLGDKMFGNSYWRKELPEGPTKSIMREVHSSQASMFEDAFGKLPEQKRNALIEWIATKDPFPVTEKGNWEATALMSIADLVYRKYPNIFKGRETITGFRPSAHEIATRIDSVLSKDPALFAEAAKKATFDSWDTQVGSNKALRPHVFSTVFNRHLGMWFRFRLNFGEAIRDTFVRKGPKSGAAIELLRSNDPKKVGAAENLAVFTELIRGSEETLRSTKDPAVKQRQHEFISFLKRAQHDMQLEVDGFTKHRSTARAAYHFTKYLAYQAAVRVMVNSMYDGVEALMGTNKRSKEMGAGQYILEGIPFASNAYDAARPIAASLGSNIPALQWSGKNPNAALRAVMTSLLMGRGPHFLKGGPALGTVIGVGDRMLNYPIERTLSLWYKTARGMNDAEW